MAVIKMSDWDFLYEMKDVGYSEAEIQDARASGAAPWEWAYIEKRKEVEYEKLKSLRDAGTISREEFKKRKAEMFR